MSTATLIISIATLLVGFVSQAIQTGKVLGIIVTPKAWVPYLTLAASFLAGFIQSIASAATIDAAAIESAVLAGLMALVGVTVGVTAHQHLTARPANDNAAPPAKAA